MKLFLATYNYAMHQIVVSFGNFNTVKQNVVRNGKKKVTELLVNQLRYCQGFCHQLLILLAHELEGSLIKLHLALSVHKNQHCLAS